MNKKLNNFQAEITQNISCDNNKGVWLFATNHMNLMYMLSAGLIMSPKGFGGKYYQDSLNIEPGWVPLYTDKIPKTILACTVKEKKSLIPVVVALNLSSVTGSVYLITNSDDLTQVKLPEELNNEYSRIYLPTPLPISLIKNIYFATKEDKKLCEQDAKEYSNVPFNKYRCSVKKSIFSGSEEFEWSKEKQRFKDQDHDMNKFLAAGAMAAMMLNMANMGNLAMDACSCAFDGGKIASEENVGSNFVRGLCEWLDKGKVQSDGDLTTQLFWGIVNEIVSLRPGRDANADCQEIILEYLKNFGQKSNERIQTELSRFMKDLKSILHLGEKSTSELLEKHKREVRRALILFFLRDKCSDLIEFTNPHLKEVDYLSAALLFAARDKWIGLPLALRDFPGLENTISHLMATMAHNEFKTGITFGSPPPRFIPIREALYWNKDKWSKKQRDAALILIRSMGWDCASTQLKLEKGTYSIIVNTGGVVIELPGVVKEIETKIDTDKFFSLMSGQIVIDRKIESEVRMKLV